MSESTTHWSPTTRKIIDGEVNRILLKHGVSRHHDASNPAMGPFCVSFIPIEWVPVSILNRCPI